MAGLKTYHSKRRFGVTSEPKGKVGRRKGSAFVIQKHDATRLHYDLRLELDGVMKSWAVTRGPSLVPGEKRLAVQVEDHPIDYNKFEGTIPEGEYGGGTVMIWDRGTWTPEDDPHKGLEKGHLSFTLDGEKLHGGWHLVRMHRRAERETRQLAAHQAARRGRALGTRQGHPRGRSRCRSRADATWTRSRSPKKVWHSNRSAKANVAARAKNARRTAGRTATSKKKVAKKVARKKTSAAKKPAARSKRSKARTRAAAAKPIRKRSKASDWRPRRRAEGGPARFSCAVPRHAVRESARRRRLAARDQVRRLSAAGPARQRQGQAADPARPRLDAQIPDASPRRSPSFRPTTALIDGEVVVEGEDGVSSFSLLQQALKDGDDKRMVFYAFDLMHLDGRDLQPLPLTARKAALEALLADAPTRGPLRFSASIDQSGPALLEQACKMGLEGIISKRADAPYRSGRGHDWLKTKCSDRQEFVIAGFTPSTADARAVGALVLGVLRQGQAALRRPHRHRLHARGRARPLSQAQGAGSRQSSPLDPLPKEERGARGPVWVEPKLVAEVDFHGWTHGDRVRQASFQGLREDKPAKDVVREVKKTVAAASRASRDQAQRARGAAQSNDRQDRRRHRR